MSEFKIVALSVLKWLGWFVLLIIGLSIIGQLQKDSGGGFTTAALAVAGFFIARLYDQMRTLRKRVDSLEANLLRYRAIEAGQT